MALASLPVGTRVVIIDDPMAIGFNGLEGVVTSHATSESSGVVYHVVTLDANPAGYESLTRDWHYIRSEIAPA